MQAGQGCRAEACRNRSASPAEGAGRLPRPRETAYDRAPGQSRARGLAPKGDAGQNAENFQFRPARTMLPLVSRRAFAPRNSSSGSLTTPATP